MLNTFMQVLRLYNDITVVIAARIHLFPFRTEKLSSLAPMVLHCVVGEQVAATFQRRTPLSRFSFFIAICPSSSPLCFISNTIQFLRSPFFMFPFPFIVFSIYDFFLFLLFLFPFKVFFSFYCFSPLFIPLLFFLPSLLLFVTPNHSRTFQRLIEFYFLYTLLLYVIPNHSRVV